jgi:prevent-host-death family protein
MKEVPLSAVKDDLSHFLREAEKHEIVITRHGKPAGVLIWFESETIGSTIAWWQTRGFSAGSKRPGLASAPVEAFAWRMPNNKWCGREDSDLSG